MTDHLGLPNTALVLVLKSYVPGDPLAPGKPYLNPSLGLYPTASRPRHNRDEGEFIPCRQSFFYTLEVAFLQFLFACLPNQQRSVHVLWVHFLSVIVLLILKASVSLQWSFNTLLTHEFLASCIIPDHYILFDLILYILKIHWNHICRLIMVTPSSFNVSSSSG